MDHDFSKKHCCVVVIKHLGQLGYPGIMVSVAFIQGVMFTFLMLGQNTELNVPVPANILIQEAQCL